MNSYKKQREEKLGELLDPQLSTGDQLRQISELVESEIASAIHMEFIQNLAEQQKDDGEEAIEVVAAPADLGERLTNGV